MKKSLLLILFLITLTCTGCVEKKIATQNAFYSTRSPSITIEYPEHVKFIGEESKVIDKTKIKTYYYAGTDESPSANRLSFFEIQSIPSGYYWEPKYLPTGAGPYTNIYTKTVGGEDFYCRTFLTNSNIGYYAKFYENNEVTIPEAIDVLVCTKKVSDTKKALFAYMRRANLDKIYTVFDYENFDPNALTSEQIHYFNDVDKELSSELTVKKFKESDLQ
ncbi:MULTISPECIES: hypothetical protein [unclassified Maridesulfovibrio]|uniref:hypothetical protein n=1 Tax=unclassified Maridesulfovibrio TaxID=2794999 RepID=UPI003B3DC96C